MNGTLNLDFFPISICKFMWKRRFRILPGPEVAGNNVSASSKQKTIIKMKEIGTISLERMNNGAHYMYLLLILEKAEADATLKTKVSGLTAALREAVTKEDECLKLSQKSLLSDKIQAADGQRDALYSGYKKGVDGYADFPVAALAESAKVLAQHIKDYDIDPKMQLDKETGLLINFIEDLEGKFAEHVTALALTPFVTNMKTANEAVRSLTASRTDERTVVEVGALKKARAARLVSRENFFVETAPFVLDPGGGQIFEGSADDDHDARVDDRVFDGVFVGGLAELEECHIAEKGIDTGVFESRIKCLRNPAVRRALTGRVIVFKGNKRVVCHACFPFLVLCHIFFTVRLYTYARNVSIMPVTFSRFSH